LKTSVGSSSKRERDSFDLLDSDIVPKKKKVNKPLSKYYEYEQDFEKEEESNEMTQEMLKILIYGNIKPNTSKELEYDWDKFVEDYSFTTKEINEAMNKDKTKERFTKNITSNINGIFTISEDIFFKDENGKLKEITKNELFKKVSHLTTSEDTIFAITEDGKIYSIDINGSFKLLFETSIENTKFFTYLNGKYYIILENGDFYTLKDGALIKMEEKFENISYVTTSFNVLWIVDNNGNRIKIVQD
jgi:outer membrane protein assembly factor BamB